MKIVITVDTNDSSPNALTFDQVQQRVEEALTPMFPLLAVEVKEDGEGDSGL